MGGNLGTSCMHPEAVHPEAEHAVRLTDRQRPCAPVLRLNRVPNFCALHTGGTQIAAQGGTLRLSPPSTTRPASFNLRDIILVIPPHRYRATARWKTLWFHCSVLLCPALSHLLRFRFTVVETEWGTGYWHAIATTWDDNASVADGAVADGDIWPEFMTDCDCDDSAPTLDDYDDFKLDAFVDSP